MFATLQHYHDFSTSYLKQAALDSWYNIYFGLPYLSQESMILSQLLFAYFYYLELSLIVLQNYRITTFFESLINSSEVPRSGKTTTTK